MNFDRIAPFYSLIERLSTGCRMQCSRMAHLEKVRDARRVLIAGEGNGRFLAVCLAALPKAQFTVVDESAAMLQLARKCCPEAERVTFIHDHILSWEHREADFDLIVTHFFLDCFPAQTLGRILEKLASVAGPKAHWLLADFCEPEKGLSRLRAKLTLLSAYVIFRFLADVDARKLTAPDDFLRQLNFQLVERNFSDWGMIHSDLWLRKLTQD